MSQKLTESDKVILCKDCKHIVFGDENLSVSHLCSKSQYTEKEYVTGKEITDVRSCIFVNNDGHCRDFEPKQL